MFLQNYFTEKKNSFTIKSPSISMNEQKKGAKFQSILRKKQTFQTYSSNI